MNSSFRPNRIVIANTPRNPTLTARYARYNTARPYDIASIFQPRHATLRGRRLRIWMRRRTSRRRHVRLSLAGHCKHANTAIDRSEMSSNISVRVGNTFLSQRNCPDSSKNRETQKKNATPFVETRVSVGNAALPNLASLKTMMMTGWTRMFPPSASRLLLQRGCDVFAAHAIARNTLANLAEKNQNDQLTCVGTVSKSRCL